MKQSPIVTVTYKGYIKSQDCWVYYGDYIRGVWVPAIGPHVSNCICGVCDRRHLTWG